MLRPAMGAADRSNKSRLGGTYSLLYRYLQWTSVVSGLISPVFDLALLFHLSYFVIIHLHLIHANI